MDRGAIFGCSVMVLLVCVGLWEAQDQVVVPNPPPSHVEWREYEVGGMILVNPSNRDSSGVLTLPRGSLLQVPQVVAGEAPDSLRVKI